MKWHWLVKGVHSPVCTCWDCNEGRLGKRRGRIRRASAVAEPPVIVERGEPELLTEVEERPVGPVSDVPVVPEVPVAGPVDTYVPVPAPVPLPPLRIDRGIRAGVVIGTALLVVVILLLIIHLLGWRS